jgi:hypothetical protein
MPFRLRSSSLSCKEGWVLASVEQDRLWRLPAFGQRGSLYGRCVQIQVGEYFLDDHRVFDASDHFDRTTAFTAGFDVDIEYASSSNADVGAFVP